MVDEQSEVWEFEIILTPDFCDMYAKENFVTVAPVPSYFETLSPGKGCDLNLHFSSTIGPRRSI